MENTNKSLILLAGAPGTGKTYAGNVIKKEFPKLIKLPLDLFKEHIYDEIGFDDIDQKSFLDEEARQRFYRALDTLMNWNKPILGDYPFSYVQKPHLEHLINKYHYSVITVRLEADTKVLFERQRQRDITEKRHPGHLMNHYHAGDIIKDRSQLDGMPSYKLFNKRMKDREYADFKLGSLIRINVNDFSKIDYRLLIQELRDYLNSTMISKS